MNACEATEDLGLTVGVHPIAYERERLKKMHVVPAFELGTRNHNSAVRVAGCVITRQRSETAKGFVFLSLEDETGVSNIITAQGVQALQMQAPATASHDFH